jgi:hypothetical protein
MFWFSTSLKDYDIALLRTRACVYNRYPRIKDIVNKKPCGNILRRLKNIYPGCFDFEPLTFFLPEEGQELRQFMKANNKEFFIAKPSGGAQGNNITLLSS